jgi:hypothetical protein
MTSITHTPARRTPSALLRSIPRELLLLLAAVLVTRLVILVAVGTAVHGDEFTEDVKLHMGFVRDPFSLVTGASRYNQFPPLIGFAEAIFAYPAQLFMSDYYAIRLTYALFEVLTAIPLYLCARELIADDRRRHWALAGYVILPMGWVTSVVMAQEEGMMTLFLLVTLYLVLKGHDRAALLVCAAGVGIIKIFLLFPLAALVFLLRRTGTFWSRALLAAAPVVVVYGGTTALAKALGHHAPLTGFTPPNSFGVNIWTYLTTYAGVGYSTAKSISTPLSVLAGLLPLGLVMLRGGRLPLTKLPLLWGAMLLWVLSLFYHVNPEYYAYVIPLFVLFFRTRLEIALLVVLSGSSWGVNLVYGSQDGKGGGRAKLADVYNKLSPVSNKVAYQFFIWLTIVSTAIAAVLLTWQTWQAAKPAAVPEAER